MSALAPRSTHGDTTHVGWTCVAPWTLLQLADHATSLLGLDGAGRISVGGLTAAQLPPAPIRLDRALVHTARTGEPLVTTMALRRFDDHAAREVVLVGEAIRDEDGGPIRLEGHIVDITDTICAGTRLGEEPLVGIVDCGAVTVVVLSGEFDLSCRDTIADTLAAASIGPGPVHVDVRHLRFADAHAARALASATTELAAHGHPVTVQHPSAVLRSALDLVGTSVRRPVATRGHPGVPPD